MCIIHELEPGELGHAAANTDISRKRFNSPYSNRDFNLQNQTKCFVAFSPKNEMVRKERRFGHCGERGGPRREAADAP